jgi:hypothetical protein
MSSTSLPVYDRFRIMFFTLIHLSRHKGEDVEMRNFVANLVRSMPSFEMLLVPVYALN